MMSHKSNPIKSQLLELGYDEYMVDQYLKYELSQRENYERLFFDAMDWLSNNEITDQEIKQNNLIKICNIIKCTKYQAQYALHQSQNNIQNALNILTNANVTSSFITNNTNEFLPQRDNIVPNLSRNQIQNLQMEVNILAATVASIQDKRKTDTELKKKKSAIVSQLVLMGFSQTIVQQAVNDKDVIDQTSAIEYIVSHQCNENASTTDANSSNSFTELLNIEYHRMSQNDCKLNIDITSVMNDFLFQFHNNEFNNVHDQLIGTCFVNKCKIFRRHYRMRSKSCIPQIYSTNDPYEIAILQIMDKIHCFYYHSYDIGLLLTPKEFESLPSNSECKDANYSGQNIDIEQVKRKVSESMIDDRISKINKLLHNKHKIFYDNCPDENRVKHRFNENDSDHKYDEDVYDFGIPFMYDYDGEYPLQCTVNINENQKPKIIKSKFKSLKEEVTQNPIAVINIDQFNSEYEK
eukprot:477412_1